MSLEDQLTALLMVQQKTLEAIQLLTLEIGESNRICSDCLILLTELVSGDEQESGQIGDDKYLDS
ncbi:hypothetical protein D0C16_05515 [Cellvibrio sp. KY-GH-1]|uniref:hypothetical protein n=1 Tax=Cellvibrio sp. KY-GH-1 TaxID=2303332 RepID=UPI0012488BB1|nr:hypothetical protein [Cellvibrio sp. KY-GH-1]QEY15478.1 hypothetical protein D0C16_05515 [Cellvibrio sp. KY-GH-1]